MGIFDKAKDVAEDAGDRAKDVGEKAGELAGKAKEAISALADEHGDKVTGAVNKGTDYVDAKTGGRIVNVTDKVDDLTEKAVGALKSGKGGGTAPPAAT